jgi:hypothetical protein
MDPESQIVHAETLNSMFDHMGVDLEAHLQSGDIIIMRKTPPK